MKESHLIKYLFINLIIISKLLQAQNTLGQISTEQFINNAHDSIFLDYKNIKIDNDYTYNIDQSTIDWGNELLKEINISELTNYEKAASINKYIYDNIGFCGFRANDIKEIIENQKGNCFSHARLGIFLLRLSGVPAKFAYEIHIRKCTISGKIKGKNKKTGLFGCAHNDHIWVFFYNNGNWIPFDSSLGIIGINEFITKRWDTKFLMGPPFVIYEDTGNGLEKMKNITIELWNNKPKDSFNIIDFNTWYEFLNSFSEMEIGDFNNPLDKSLLLKISKMSKLWYN